MLRRVPLRASPPDVLSAEPGARHRGSARRTHAGGRALGARIGRFAANDVLPAERRGCPPTARSGLFAANEVLPADSRGCPPSARLGRFASNDVLSADSRGRPPSARLRRFADQRGQASAEFVALLPLLALVLAGAFQFVLAGDALWHARVAARAAARAQAVGADPAAAARAHLPARLEHALRVRAGTGEGDIRVSIRVPTVLGALDLGRVSSTAHFEPQGGT